MTDGRTRRDALTAAGLIGAAAPWLSAASATTVGATAPDGALSVRAFGARGDGQADDRPAIQAAIDQAAAAGGGTVLLPPGRYRIALTLAPDRAGLVGLWMRSGVRLLGADRRRSVLALADGQLGPGTYARIVASGELADAALADFTLDANRAGQGAQRDAGNGGAVMLGTGGAHCERVVVEGLTVTGANGQGIQLIGYPGAPSRDVAIRGNRVVGASYIGIQASHFDGLTIAGNEIVDCHDNAIDVFGDDIVTNGNVPTGRNALITGNRTVRCASGVFLETVKDVTVAGNEVTDARVTGLHVNRIHGEPSDILVTGNRFGGAPIGASITGDSGGITFLANQFSRFATAGLQFGLNGQGNVSMVAASGNVFDCRGESGPPVFGCAPDGVLTWIRVQDNIVYGQPGPDRLFVNRYRTNRDVRVERFVGVQGDLPRAVPRHAGDPGRPGETAWDDAHFYVCVAPDRWRRTALAAW